jgi:uncharacterized protein (TIGR02231 family)
MADSTDVDAPIVAVTVFRDGARVQRSGLARVAPGLGPVVIGGLPAQVDPASVRVVAHGDGLALLDVEVHRRYRTDPLREEAVERRADVDRCRDQLQELADEDAAEQARLAFVSHLSEAAATALARAMSYGRASQDDVAGMAGHLSADTAAALGRRREISVRRRDAVRELEAAEQRLQDTERRSSGAVAYTEVSAAIEAEAAVNAEIDVYYHVPGAAWRPLYDLTVDGEHLAVSYLAEVRQKSGEDWPAVELVLSTTRRGVHQALPELDPWYIERARPQPPAVVRGRAMARMPEGAPGSGPPDDAVRVFAAAAPLPEAPPLAAEPAEPGEQAAAVAYRVPRPLAVPGDGEPCKTTVGQFEVDAQLDHLAIPVLATEAYARATVTNTSPLLLLPGPVRVFRGLGFVGETSLGTVAAGQEFELQLGVDDQIRLERQLLRRAATKAMIGGTRAIDIGYEITVENHRASPARISVHDHIPTSSDADIKVRLREVTPEPVAHTDLGELIWNLTLDPGLSAQIKYRFTVDYPSHLTVSGL